MLRSTATGRAGLEGAEAWLQGNPLGHHESVHIRRRGFRFLLPHGRSLGPCLLLLAGVLACRGPQRPHPARPASPAAVLPARPLARLGYTIQAGAFAKAENAARLAEQLQASGLEATYFRASDGLHKVRFGDFPTREAARRRAEALKGEGRIETYYLVMPESQPAPGLPAETDALRRGLADTARGFLGVPYLWGGTDAVQGFDCSGLAMTVYRLHGLKLPRSSRDQFSAGAPVDRDKLREGDLIFFDMSGNNSVDHVAVYLGSGRFVHAPGRGRRIETESLTNPYFGARFVGARTYV